MHRISGLTLGIVGLVLLLGGGQSWAQQNTHYGTDALASVTTGTGDTAVGAYALDYNTTGSDNTAVGAYALPANTTGAYNTASGAYALPANTTGSDNTASGAFALYDNTTGYNNTGSGIDALYSNTTGSYNTAAGGFALYSNTTASNNAASGAYALFSNTTGTYNTASGAYALHGNTTGNSNTADGYFALYNTTGTGNTAFGADAGKANTSGTHNTFIGASVGPTAGNFTNGTALGYGATLRASNTVVLGNSSITKIVAKVTSITAISDRRLKKDIAALPAELGLGFIEKLKPVSYRFNDGDETQRYGFIAQDVEQALPASLHDAVETSQPEHGLAMVERGNDKARTYRMSYGELTAPMVKSIQDQQQEIAALRRALADQAAASKAEIDALRRSIETLRQQVVAVNLTRN